MLLLDGNVKKSVLKTVSVNKWFTSSGAVCVLQFHSYRCWEQLCSTSTDSSSQADRKSARAMHLACADLFIKTLI